MQLAFLAAQQRGASQSDIRTSEDSGGGLLGDTTGITPQPYTQLVASIKHIIVYGALSALLVLDSLTVVQKAMWVVSSYPW